jgi:cellobiose-specific phosphotransferase system component IIB
MSILENPEQFFSQYILLSGIAHLGPEKQGDPALLGKRLGLLNGSSWITAWSNYFGRLYLPGVHLVNIGNEAIQLNFMQAYAEGKHCPPQTNIDRFVQYAKDLVELAQVDAVLITCSTMNRSYQQVSRALEPYGVPVIQIDMPMMDEAVRYGGKILVLATHGPTVASTQELLATTARRQGKNISFDGLTVEEAWRRLEKGDVAGHNQVLADVIAAQPTGLYSCVVLAQLSMSAFLFSYPDPQAKFNLHVLTSGQCGFQYMAKILKE